MIDDPIQPIPGAPAPAGELLQREGELGYAMTNDAFDFVGEREGLPVEAGGDEDADFLATGAAPVKEGQGSREVGAADGDLDMDGVGKGGV